MRTPRRFRTAQPAAQPSQAAQLQPSRFAVNQAWLVIRANRSPLMIDGAPSSVYVLQDAGSMFIFGNVFAPWDGGEPSRVDVDSLLQRAWSEKRQWPQTLLLPDASVPRRALASAAKRAGLAVEVLPEPVFITYVEDVQSSFESHFSGNDESAA